MWHLTFLDVGALVPGREPGQGMLRKSELMYRAEEISADVSNKHGIMPASHRYFFSSICPESLMISPADTLTSHYGACSAHWHTHSSKSLPSSVKLPHAGSQAAYVAGKRESTLIHLGENIFQCKKKKFPLLLCLDDEELLPAKAGFHRLPILTSAWIRIFVSPQTIPRFLMFVLIRFLARRETEEARQLHIFLPGCLGSSPWYKADWSFPTLGAAWAEDLSGLFQNLTRKNIFFS